MSRAKGAARRPVRSRGPAPRGAGPAGSRGSTWTQPLGAGVLLLLAGVAVYANSLPSPFVFDDADAITRNPFITSLWPLSQALSAPGQSAFAGRPVASLSLAVSYAAGGLSPAVFRAWNVAVLIATAMVLYGVVRRTMRRIPADRAAGADAVALAAALVWLVHPLQTEVVDYVTQRTESMMGLFYLSTLYAAIRAADAADAADSGGGPGRGARWTVAAVLACALGMACKESMASAPVMVLLWDLVFGARSLGEAWRRRAALYAGMALTWGLLAYLVAGAPRSHSAGFTAGVSAWTYLLNQAVMVVTYLRLAIWPHPLVLDYGVTTPVALATVLPYGLVVVLLLAAVAGAWRRHRELAFLGTWFFVTLAPTSSVIPIATEVGAERRMYLPLAAIVVLALAGAGAAIRRLRPDAGAVGPRMAVGAICLALGAASVARNREYRDPVGIWQTVLDRRPHGRAHYNMAIALKERGQTAEALAHYRLASADEPAAHYALGFELWSVGQFDDAATHFRAFLAARPDDAGAPKASFLLGQSLARLGRYAEAEHAFRETLRMAPRDGDARMGLADLMLSQARYADAVPLYRSYLETSPANASARHNLGMALVATEQPAQAIPEFERAVSLSPSDPNLRASLGHALASVGRLEEAVDQYRAGLRLAPSDARLMSALALTLAAGGEVNEPIDLFRRARALAPNDPEVQSDYETAVGRWKGMH